MLRVAAVTAAALLAFLVSCFDKPDAPHAPDGGPGNGTDAHYTDAPATMPDAPSGCVQDDFNNTAVMNCDTWGTAQLSSFATITRQFQTLRFQFAGGTSASGACQTKVPIDITKGTSIRIVTFATYMMSMSLTWQGLSSPVVFSFMQGGMVPYSMSCPGGSPVAGMLGTTPIWMQLRVENPGAGGVRVVAEYSTSETFTSWSPAGQCTFSGTVPTKATVSFAGSGAAPSNAEFDDFNVRNCSQ